MKTALSSVFHQPQPPASCWKSARRSIPAFNFAASSSLFTSALTLSSFKARDTTTLGRKLDIVCSVQPYGNAVRYSSALNMAPATDGLTEISIIRDCGTVWDGNCRVASADPLFATAPERASLSFTPYGLIG